jgi:acyl-ACP thioesterase
VARVQTDWLLLDRRNRPARLPPEFEHAFPMLGADDALARVELPEPPEGVARQPVRARPHELDPMGHVNNAVYVDWLEEAIAAASTQDSTPPSPRRMGLEYLGSAAPGVELGAIAWPADHGWLFRLDAGGQVLVRARATEVSAAPA